MDQTTIQAQSISSILASTHNSGDALDRLHRQYRALLRDDEREAFVLGLAAELMVARARGRLAA